MIKDKNTNIKTVTIIYWTSFLMTGLLIPLYIWPIISIFPFLCLLIYSCIIFNVVSKKNRIYKCLYFYSIIIIILGWLLIGLRLYQFYKKREHIKANMQNMFEMIEQKSLNK
ncbi:hypothetical protein AAEX28_15445 [Lentisphaerota bacterium WC36G]|nr:hypothetical protein LJT99_02200 [Lentisphaerae bacterium WC36]